jgi:hypothetical protein
MISRAERRPIAVMRANPRSDRTAEPAENAEMGREGDVSGLPDLRRRMVLTGCRPWNVSFISASSAVKPALFHL